jgi:hypothetical protein
MENLIGKQGKKLKIDRDIELSYKLNSINPINFTFKLFVNK